MSAMQLTIHGAHFTIRRIGVLRALYLGDLLLAIPALRALRQRFPAAEISLIGLPWSRELLPYISRYVDRFVEFPGYPGIAELPYDSERCADFIATQRTYGYDLVIQMHGNGSVSNGLVTDIAPRLSLGYALPNDERLALRQLYHTNEHEILRWLKLVECLGATSNTRIRLDLSGYDKMQAADLLHQLAPNPGPLIGLHAGAKDPARRWPPKHFAALANGLYLRYGAQLVLTGTADERALTAAIASASHAPLLDLAGCTNIGSFAALLTRLDLLVTNDTGASHLAAAMGTPSVVLFGPTRPAQFAPLDRQRHHVVDALELAPPGYDPALALRQLPVAAVLEACVAQLAAYGAPHGRCIVT